MQWYLLIIPQIFPFRFDGRNRRSHDWDMYTTVELHGWHHDTSLHFQSKNGQKQQK